MKLGKFIFLSLLLLSSILGLAQEIFIPPVLPAPYLGGNLVSGSPNVWAPPFHADVFSGATIDVKWNACNVTILLLGGGTCDATNLGAGIFPDGTAANTGTIAATAYAGGLPKPVLAQSGSGTLTATAVYRVVTRYISAVNSKGTVISKEASITLTGGNQTIVVTSPSTFSGQITTALSTQYEVFLTAGNGASGTEVSCGLFTLGTPATITANCGGAAFSGQGEKTAFLLPPAALWQVTITDGTCGIEAFDSTTLYSLSSGITNAQFIVHSNSAATNVNALVCTDTDSVRGVGRVISMSGVRARNDNGATMTSGAAFVIGGNGGNLVDGSIFSGIGASATVGDGLWVANVCCNDTFAFVQTNGLSNNSTGIGGRPLHVGDGGGITRGVTFLSTTAVNPGNGNNNIFIGTSVQGVSFAGTTYFEGTKGSGCDTTNHFVELNGNNDSVNFDTDYVGGGCPGTTTGVTASGNGTTETFTSPQNWGAGFTAGVLVTVTGCSVGGYNGASQAIASGGSGTTSLTITAATSGAATGCIFNLTNGNTQYVYDITLAGQFHSNMAAGGPATGNFYNDHVHSKTVVGAINQEAASYSFANGSGDTFGGALEVVGAFTADGLATANTLFINTAGSAASPVFRGSGMASNTGMFFGATTFGFTFTGTNSAQITSAGFGVANNKTYCFSSTSLATGGCDTGYSRTAAATHAFGNGTNGDTSGILQFGSFGKVNGKLTVGSTGGAATFGNASLTAQVAAIGSTALCATTCPTGQYSIDFYLDSTVVCATPGPAVVGVQLAWTDETGTKSGITVPLIVNGGVTMLTTMALGNATNSASGHVNLWSVTGNNINYLTTYTGCTSGTGTYAIRGTAAQVQ